MNVGARLKAPAVDPENVDKNSSLSKERDRQVPNNMATVCLGATKGMQGFLIPTTSAKLVDILYQQTKENL